MGTPVSALVRTKIDQWLAARGWQAFGFQREVWRAIADGESGLLHASTGSGKTYAVWLGALARWAEPRVPPAPTAESEAVPASTPAGKKRGSKRAGPDGNAPLTVLWLTPMRALAADTGRALALPLEEMQLAWSVGVRTGDTSSSERTRQAKKLPSALVTTPESLTLMLTRADARESLGRVAMVIVDEWHELIGNKRGVQLQLALARLRRWNPNLVVWGLSATLGNLPQARDVLLGERGRLVQGAEPKVMTVDTLIPDTIERFPWAGHLGLRQLPRVIAELETSATSLVFTNTRSQTELWYQSLLEARPDWAGVIALHHGSLDRELRDWVELGLKEGRLKVVVCTSSLDLGVDFLPVERVMQVGSPKGVARLMQRAGRSGHAPGRVSRVTCVPTHALELIEAAAARRAAAAGRIESRPPPTAPMDVLVQHLVSMALGGGFREDEMLAEVRTTHAYRGLTDEQWRWAMAFVVRGGDSLHAYPEYHRVVPDEAGLHRVPDATIARRHRMSIGTIVSDASMDVRWLSGGRIGHIEEQFVSRLKKGECFLFAGRLLELIRIEDMTAYVKKARPGSASVPRWQGGKSPLSSELADAVLELMRLARDGVMDEPEMRAIATLLELQSRVSRLPTDRELVVETVQTREGFHFFCYPFAGRAVHTGLASLAAWRIGRSQPASFSISVNDHGFELLSTEPVAWRAALREGLFSLDKLEEDILGSLNAGELAKRRFREIARVSGLVFQGYPGAQKSTRQVQASSGLFFDVFEKHDAGNLLLAQARRETLEQELEIGRLRAVLERINARPVQVMSPEWPSPFAFPLMVERIRESLTTERVADRVQRMLRELEDLASGRVPQRDDTPDAPPRVRRAARGSPRAPSGRGVQGRLKL